MARLAPFSDPRILSGFASGGDAGVYLLPGGQALVQSVDVFTPIVDDPYTFGQIAAANALSDIYAVGARPLCALNILCFPCGLRTAAGEVLRGGADVIRAAGAVILGGHTVDDAEPKYGLAVTGAVHRKALVTHQGAKPGDLLILTKKIGVGLITSAHRSGQAPHTAGPGWKRALAGSMTEAVESMKRTNQNASEAMIASRANACTDVTGFGLLGHARNMAEKSGVCLAISAMAVPTLPLSLELATGGAGGGGTRRNMAWIKKATHVDKAVGPGYLELLCDPQTSGGLLISAPKKSAAGLLARLRDGGDVASAIIGRVEKSGSACVRLLP